MYIFIYLFIAHCGVDRNMLLEKKKKKKKFFFCAGLCALLDLAHPVHPFVRQVFAVVYLKN